MKIVTIIGARPQFIKASVVSRAMAEAGLREIMIHTGQHFDQNMSDVFFEEMEIAKPAYHLGIGGGTHGQNTGRMIEAVEAVLMQEKPDMVLVYGDTDSTLAGALAASKLHIPLAHVEAGLRSYNRAMPEEINRVLTDHIASLLFVPTSSAVDNLHKEGISGAAVIVSGDVMYDVALYYAKKAEASSKILARLDMRPFEYVLATLHRAENTDDPSRLSGIVEGLGRSELPVILPLHPRTKNAFERNGLSVPNNIRLIDPVGYLDMVMLEKHAAVIATDSGGVQKEAYFYGVPCVTMRDETEWVELVAHGVNTLTGASAEKISAAIAHGIAKNRSDNMSKDGGVKLLYGDGRAAQKIVQAMREFLIENEAIRCAS
ncbi:MAG: non-hydrolyzing UDP-N-acetylglucosamine 2-epimerase [Alphaproteobacteria bacterium]